MTNAQTGDMEVKSLSGAQVPFASQKGASFRILRIVSQLNADLIN